MKRKLFEYVISTAASHLSESAVQALPQISSRKRTIYNVRQKEREGLANPIHRRVIVLTTEQAKTHKGVQFLLCNSGPYDDRILIFSTQNNLSILEKSEDLQVDGKFKTVPQLFEQLYTVHAVNNNCAIPVVYALLPRCHQRSFESANTGSPRTNNAELFYSKCHLIIQQCGSS